MSPNNSPIHASENRILASLPKQDYKRLLPDFKHVTLALGEVLYEADEAIRHVYFPTGSVAPLIWDTERSFSVELGMVGSEGMSGISLISGVKTLPYRTIAQGAGGAVKMKASALISEFNKRRALHDLLLQYNHGLFIRVGLGQ